MGCAASTPAESTGPNTPGKQGQEGAKDAAAAEIQGAAAAYMKKKSEKDLALKQDAAAADIQGAAAGYLAKKRAADEKPAEAGGGIIGGIMGFLTPGRAPAAAPAAAAPAAA